MTRLPSRFPLPEVFDILLGAHRENSDPQTVQERLLPLQADFPEIHIDVIPEWNEAAESFDYDVLLFVDGVGTVLVSFSPDRELIWTLKTARNHDNQVIAFVNGDEVTVEHALTLIGPLWEKENLHEKLINQVILRQEAQKYDLSVDPAEVEREFEAFRRRQGLHTIESLTEWMRQAGFTLESLEKSFTTALRHKKLVSHLISEEAVGHQFRAHPEGFTLVFTLRLSLSNRQIAEDTVQAIRSGATNWYALAEQAYLEAEQGASRNLFATFRRGLVGNEYQALFQAQPGDIVGPLRNGERYEIFRILKFQPAEFTPELKDEIREKLFQNWLKARRSEARISWFWGNIERLKDENTSEEETPHS